MCIVLAETLGSSTVDSEAGPDALIRRRDARVGSVDSIDTSGFGITAGLAIGPS